ncbi:MAG TPA: alpha/beta fold hydrolase [Candidatus Obscuribacterales bacterium]
MSKRLVQQRISLLSLFGFSLLFAFTTTPGPTRAEIIKEEQAHFATRVKTPVYEWRNPAVKPKAVAIAVHGLTLHGGIYDALARHLSAEGFIVLAPDLHGYGRWLTQDNEKTRCPDCGSHLCYSKSRSDLVELIDSTSEAYPDLPLYLIGESLGADMVLYSVTQRPHLVDGMILSSPAIKRRLNLVPRVAKDAAFVMQNPFKKLDLAPYIKMFASEDPRIVNEALSDPLVRKKLSVWDLLKTSQTIRPTLKYADQIPPDMPVLIIQGDKDRMLKSNAVVQLLEHLNSSDQTVRWFKGKGHLLLETAYLEPDLLNIMDGWLKEHLDSSRVMRASAAVVGKIKAPGESESEAEAKTN